MIDTTEHPSWEELSTTIGVIHRLSTTHCPKLSTYPQVIHSLDLYSVVEVPLVVYSENHCDPTVELVVVSQEISLNYRAVTTIVEAF